MAVVVGFVVAQEHDGAVSLLVQEVDGLAAHQREIDVHAGAAGVRRRIADSHARLGKSAGLSGALVILLHVEQHDAIRKIALRHAADILHCIRTGQQHHVIPCIPCGPCGAQEVGVVPGLVDVASNRGAQRDDLVAHAAHLTGAGVRSVTELLYGGHDFVGGFRRD